MKNNFSFSVYHWLTARPIRGNFRIVLFLGILFDLCLIHSVLGCPERCKCTVEKQLFDAVVPGGHTTTLIWGTISPPSILVDRELRENITINCQKVGLKRIHRPSELNGLDPANVIKLDYGNNKIEKITQDDFQFFTSLRYLKLSNNRIDKIESNSLDGLQLKILMLDGNHLPALISGVFPHSLEEISLEDNFLTLVPSALTSLSALQALNLASNKISVVHEGDLRGLSSLHVLKLDRNQIVEIEDRALASLPNLQTLDLSNNLLTEVPSAVLLCTEILQLYLTNNRITWVSEFAFQKLTKLEDLALMGNPIEETHVNSFKHLPALKKLILKETRKLTEFPNLIGSSGLEMIRIDRGSLQLVPPELCNLLPRLRSLVLHRNEIVKLPNLEVCWHLRLLDLSNNKIEDLSSFAFENQKNLQDLLLQHNLIKEISSNTFKGLSSLQVLNLEHNLITTIQPDAFLPLISLEDINVGNNFFPEFPSVGLERVVNLKAHNNRHLKTFPSPGSFPSVHSLVLSYAYHCCPFLSRRKPFLENGESSGFIEDVVFSVDGLKDLDPTFWNVSSVWPDIENTKDFEELWADLAAEFPSMELETTALSSTHTSTTVAPKHSDSIQCIPTPGPFMPCKDLFDWWTLRCGVWIVFLMALLGNGVVVIVLIFARAKMDVPRFLVTNLAMADFFMGIYLGFLAVVDASTLGEFRMYAIPWQMSSGCQAAGFFGVLSSELSVYTLTVITLERNYAITHAMHLNKRLSLRHAAYIMTIGWAFASVMATLPIIGISDYRKFAICLPFETAGGGLFYVIFLMFINGLAFIILMACYLKIYCSIRGSQAWNSNDSRIAKRMALLVFTDFLCWAPIAFFSLTAASGLQLISLEEAKIFTVFILPLNSCCNPFLYALLTKQFKKDCVMLCKTIEESRVTRGIGRCRHSSNFSNRQTPANTNSAVDQTSKAAADNQTCVCQSSKQTEHRKLKNRLRMAAMKYFVCHSRETEENNSSSESSYKKTKNNKKNNRNASLSSETYSSSWSDNFKKSKMPMSLRILEKRRPNWILSRKPSNDSNLSSSRNDSSATTASTSTWRISRSSRSSVSSDISSAGSKGLGKKDPQGSLRIGSIRERQSEVQPPGGSGKIASITKGSPHSQVLVMQTAASPGSWVSSLIRGKPRIYRQTAVERETYFTKKGDPEASMCVLHKRGEDLSCVYEQESYEEEETQSNLDSNVTYLTPNYSSSSKTGFIQRKLSSISSRPPSTPTKEPNKEEHPIRRDEESLEKTSHTKDQIFFDDGRCVSLTMLSQSPIRTIAERCPSEGFLCPSHQRLNLRPTSAKSTDCIRRYLSSDLRDFSNFRQSPVCTETTALMESDSEDDDVFLEEGGRRKHFETHFPLEGDCEETLIKEIP